MKEFYGPGEDRAYRSSVGTFGVNVSDAYLTVTATGLPPRVVVPVRSWIEALQDLDVRLSQLWSVVQTLEQQRPERVSPIPDEVPRWRDLSDRVAHLDLIAEQLVAISARLSGLL